MSIPNDTTPTARAPQRRCDDDTRARLAAIVRSSADAIIGETMDGIITDWNPAAERLYGYTEAEVIGRHRSLLIPPEEVEAVDARVARLRRGEHIESVKAVRWTKDGRRIDVSLTVSPVWNEADELIAIAIIVRDITARMQADDAQARLAAIVDSAEDAIISTSVDGTITSWNCGAERLFGYQAVQALGQPFTMLLPDDPNDPTLEWRRAALAGASVPPFETTRRRRDGTTFAASIALSSIRDRAGQIVGISSINRDITAQKQAEAALAAALSAAETANQAKSHFLAMMSHELRTPLQAVLGYAEFLLVDPRALLTADQRADLGYIQQGGQRMLAIVNQLLDLSRLEAGGLTLQRKPVDLAPVLEAVRQDVAPQAGQHGIALRVALPTDCPPVLGDAERLRQILLNLAGNAVKFTTHGVVEVTAQTTGDSVAISVRDTGCGIAPEALPYIFEAFRQVDNRLTRRHGGAGLGLAIAQKLAELMDGRITVDSHLGEGSTFTLLVPTAPQAHTPVSP